GGHDMAMVLDIISRHRTRVADAPPAPGLQFLAPAPGHRRPIEKSVPLTPPHRQVSGTLFLLHPAVPLIFHCTPGALAAGPGPSAHALLPAIAPMRHPRRRHDARSELYETAPTGVHSRGRPRRPQAACGRPRERTTCLAARCERPPRCKRVLPGKCRRPRLRGWRRGRRMFGL